MFSYLFEPLNELTLIYKYYISIQGYTLLQSSIAKGYVQVSVDFKIYKIQPFRTPGLVDKCLYHKNFCSREDPSSHFVSSARFLSDFSRPEVRAGRV